MLLFRRSLPLTLCAALTVTASREAAAQTPTASETTLAREQFRAGVAAVREARWTDALSAFQRSYALVPQPITLLNIAGAQVETGQLVAGAESYRRFLAQATDGAAAEHRTEASEALARAEARVAHATVDVIGMESADQLTLDAQPLGRATVGMSIPVDPGPHVFAVRRGGDELARVSVTFRVADLQRVSLAVRSGAMVGADPVVPDAPPPRRGGVLRSPWFWTVVGVVVAGGAATAVVLATRSDPETYAGNLNPGRVTVR